MKTLRDTNNNNSSTAQANWRNTNGMDHAHRSEQSSFSVTAGGGPASLKAATPTTNFKLPPPQSSLNPLAPGFNGDFNPFSSLIQSCLSKLGGNQAPPMDPAANPLLYLQLINANGMLMQQLAAMQRGALPTAPEPMQYFPHMPISQPNLSVEPMELGSDCHVLQADSNVFVPKTRPMTQDEIAEHARLVYQRALQRTRSQQNSELVRHYYHTPDAKLAEEPSMVTGVDQSEEVPSVPNVSYIGAFDALDGVTTSPSSCYSVRESSIDAALSSVSLLSADDTRMPSGASSALDPAAPVFVPRQSRPKLDEDIETSSSSSDSDFNDFHYLDQFLDEFYDTTNRRDNHLIVRKCASDDKMPSISIAKNNGLGQGDANNVPAPPLPGSTTAEKHDHQYSIYELLDRYRNPRCHLVLPEWSRLSLILPNVCSMRAHTYKIKRYFAYRRRLHDDRAGHVESADTPLTHD